MLTLQLTNTANNAIIDKILEQSGVLSSKITGVTDLKKYVIEECSKLHHISNFIIDLGAFESNNVNDIIFAIEQLRQMYTFRIIIIAAGYEQNNLLLGKIFDMGIYNIITGNNQQELEESARPCFSKEGKNFKDVSQFRIEPIVQESTEAAASVHRAVIVKEKPVLIKPYVTIGLCGINQHMGTTHHALAITRHISKAGLKCCYIEANDHNDIAEIKNYLGNVKDVDDMLQLEHLKIFPNAKDYMSILKKDFNVYVFDYGTITQISARDLFSMDLRIIVAGGKPWEIDKYISAMSNMQGIKGICSIMNFIPESLAKEMSDFMQGFGVSDIYFARYAPDPFEDDSNQNIYSEICKTIIESGNQQLKLSENKKKWLFRR